jgi:hypothetical protein
MKIRNLAGQMRGVRVMRDPNGILFSPFTGMDGLQYGYVIVPTEDSPAVFDGKEWHSILAEDIEDWTTFSMSEAQMQFSALQANAALPEYQTIMNSMYGMVTG